eukprot:CAMPEP_0113870634 /NCGR_PEP_ID=MMETSP0780_2-20120614/2197_1 /TAXON_ID=652834 /ORGANISM="Palpitomonas bilix" /LENGTH=196 /DNA_ID=CAMNT_0000855937 /DNA_START=173 /DNA_END=763 /DNA_ORIENTATION=- /assembly_acc=CAM_ASM_000599
MNSCSKLNTPPLKSIRMLPMLQPTAYRALSSEIHDGLRRILDEGKEQLDEVEVLHKPQPVRKGQVHAEGLANEKRPAGHFENGEHEVDEDGAPRHAQDDDGSFRHLLPTSLIYEALNNSQQRYRNSVKGEHHVIHCDRHIGTIKKGEVLMLRSGVEKNEEVEQHVARVLCQVEADKIEVETHHTLPLEVEVHLRPE